MSKSCPNCHTELAAHIKYCFNCGTNVELIGLEVCQSCGKRSPEGASRCYGCGRSLKQPRHLSLDVVLQYPLHLDDPEGLYEDLKGHFFKLLRRTIETELRPKEYSNYVELFYSSGFERVFRKREAAWEDEVYGLYDHGGNEALAQIDERTARELSYLLEGFIVLHGGKMNETKYPQAILKYHDAKPNSVDQSQMMLDYLAFEDERLVVYTNMMNMPQDKMHNAQQSFLNMGSDELLVCIADLSPFGTTFKDGFALTNRAIYWRCFDKPQRYFFHQLDDIRRDKSYMTINGKFFNAGLSFNLKLIKLLKKLKELYG